MVRVRLATIALTACLLANAAGQKDQADEAPTFGTTVVVPYGLVGDIYYMHPDSVVLPDFDKLVPVGRIYTNRLNIPEREFTSGFPGVTSRIEWFAIDYNGRFWAETPGKYKFSLQSDDGSRLFIDDRLEIDNDGIHAPVTMSSSVNLARGIHHIRISYFQGPRYSLALILSVCVPGGKWRIFDTNDLKPPSNTTGWDAADIKALEEMQKDPSRRPKKTSKDLALEAAALEKISGDVLPHDFSFRSEVLQFPGAAGGKTDFLVAYEVPLNNLRPQIDDLADTRTWRIILLASIRDDAGKVVDEMKLDVPFATTEGHANAVSGRHFSYQHRFQLPPGKYRITTGVADRGSHKISASTEEVASDAASGVKISSLVMVDHVQPGGTDLTDPLVYQGQRLVPMLQRQVSAKEQRGIFFWARPDPAIAEKPRLEVDFLIDGKLAVKETPAIPDSNDSGKIPMSFGAPACPGKCQLRVIAMQGATRSAQDISYESTESAP